MWLGVKVEFPAEFEIVGTVGDVGDLLDGDLMRWGVLGVGGGVGQGWWLCCQRRRDGRT